MSSALRDKLRSLWPLIPGTVLTLIGVCFLLFDKKVNGMIVCYVGLMASIGAAGKMLIQQVYYLDSESADRRAQSEKASENVVLDFANREI